MTHTRPVRFVVAFMFWILVGTLSSCTQGGDGGDAGAQAKTKAGDPNSTEMFDWAYGYLVTGDPEFTRMAPNYSTLRPFTHDSALVVELASEAEKREPAADEPQFFQVRVNRPLAVRMIVADSLGKGLITYEFASVPNGSYTMGKDGWPVPQIELVEGQGWVYVYFVGDRRFRTRYQFNVGAKGQLLPRPEGL